MINPISYGLSDSVAPMGGRQRHTCKKFVALLAARGQYLSSSKTYGIIFSQSESKMCQNWKQLDIISQEYDKYYLVDQKSF